MCLTALLIKFMVAFRRVVTYCGQLYCNMVLGWCQGFSNLSEFYSIKFKSGKDFKKCYNI